MKEIRHETGIKGVLGDDFLTLQKEIATAIESILQPYGNVVLSGCEVENGNVFKGVCFLDGKVRRIPAINNVTLPSYIISKDYTEGERDYQTGGKKPAYDVFGTEIVQVAPAGNNYIEINSQGNVKRLDNSLLDKIREDIINNTNSIVDIQNNKANNKEVTNLEIRIKANEDNKVDNEEIEVLKLKEIDLTSTSLDLDSNEKKNIYSSISISHWTELLSKFTGSIYPVEITNEQLLPDRYLAGDLSNNLDVFFSCDGQRQKLGLVFDNGKKIFWERVKGKSWSVLYSNNYYPRITSYTLNSGIIFSQNYLFILIGEVLTIILQYRDKNLPQGSDLSRGNGILDIPYINSHKIHEQRGTIFTTSSQSSNFNIISNKRIEIGKFALSITAPSNEHVSRYIGGKFEFMI